jgi:hypothetical protein
MNSNSEQATFTTAISRQAADSEPKSQPLATDHLPTVAGEDGSVLILESLEHAKERNAEILAELVLYDPTDDSILAQPPESGGGYPPIVVEPKREEAGPESASQSDAAVERNASAPYSTFYSVERKRGLPRVALGASGLLLCLFAMAFYHQQIKGAATEARRALIAAWSRPLANQSTPAASSTTPTKAKPHQAQGLTLGAGTSPSSASLPQLTDRTTVVVVEPRDTLRQICLRNIGWYDARLLSKIKELNPGLADPDHVIVDQRIVIPVSVSAGTAARGASSAPEP